MITDSWAGCYPSQWKGMIVPDAIVHPAKFSSRLIRRIYDHMREEGWVLPGDTVIDPFGGVALGAMDAMRLGLSWRGVELEPRFVDLGNQNIAVWKHRYSFLPNWNRDAVLLNGDSRNLAQVLAEAGECVSSPPYANILEKLNGIDPNKSENDSGPNSQMRKTTRYSGIDWSKQADRTTAHPHGWNGEGYSAAAVSSPPYADGCTHEGGDTAIRLEGGTIHLPGINGVISSPPYSEARIGQESGQEHCGHGDQYGATPGQLGAMKANGFEAAVSSPPFEDGSPHNGGDAKFINDKRLFGEYGCSDGQLGNDTGNDFWTAARTIVDQVYQVLSPGGHACWVVKDFVKSKARVPFCDQWRQMCEAAGFVTLHEHHALLVHSTEHDFDGNEKRRESKSFFRRLAENKGSPKIDYEVVLCMEKR